MHHLPIIPIIPCLLLILSDCTCDTRQVDKSDVVPVIPPKLTVVLVIDQMRQQDLMAHQSLWRFGFKRLLAEGRVYENAFHSHARTETAAGHATIATGVTPRFHGVVDKRFFDAARGEVVAVCDYHALPDSNSESVIGNVSSKLCSAAALQVPTLGDRLKSTHTNAKVVALAEKDRSAALLGGRHGDLVAWQHEFSLVGHTIIPETLRRLHDLRLAGEDRITRIWELPQWPRDYTPPPDDVVGEHTAGIGRSFPHRVPDDQAKSTATHPVPSYYAWFSTPDADRVLRELATAALVTQKLGTDQTPDLLWVSFGGFDAIGHNFGPNSVERLAALTDLDYQIGEFLDALESAVPRGLLLALTADHGVAPLISQAPKPSRRVMRSELENTITAALSDDHGIRAFSFPFVTLRKGIGNNLVDKVVQSLNQLPYVERAFNNRTFKSPTTPLGKLVLENIYPGRSGDISIVLKPYHALYSAYRGREGAEHGTPWPYDRHVPLVLWGDSVQVGRVTQEVHVIDLTRTLADRLGLPHIPHEGKPLP